MPKFLGYFELILSGNQKAGRYILGRSVSYVDLSLFQLIAGLNYAFPDRMKQLKQEIPCLVDLHNRVSCRPRIAAYLASSRRIPFNKYGIFRHYPELDKPVSDDE